MNAVTARKMDMITMMTSALVMFFLKFVFFLIFDVGDGGVERFVVVVAVVGDNVVVVVHVGVRIVLVVVWFPSSPDPSDPGPLRRRLRLCPCIICEYDIHIIIICMVES